MKLNFKRRKVGSLRKIDITPLVDVVFLLLIFFMLTSNYVLQAGIRVDLPSASDVFSVPPVRVEVYITKNDRLFFQGKERPPEELFSLLKKAKAENDTVLIFADLDSRHGRVVQVEDLCRRAGFRDISVATKTIEDVGR